MKSKNPKYNVIFNDFLLGETTKLPELKLKAEKFANTKKYINKMTAYISIDNIDIGFKTILNARNLLSEQIFYNIGEIIYHKKGTKKKNYIKIPLSRLKYLPSNNIKNSKLILEFEIYPNKSGNYLIINT